MDGSEPHAANQVEANVALIQSIYDAFGRGDVGFIATQVVPGGVWDFNATETDVPWYEPTTTPGDLPRFFGSLMSNVDLSAFEVRHFVASGEDVVAHIRIAMTVKRNGRNIDQQQLHWWKVRGGRVASMRHYEDTAQVISAWRGAPVA